VVANDRVRGLDDLRQRPPSVPASVRERLRRRGGIDGGFGAAGADARIFGFYLACRVAEAAS
jgi:hypothetical protein